MDAAAANSAKCEGSFNLKSCGVKSIVVVGALLNQSCPHIAHARIRRQAQGPSLAFRSGGCNNDCHCPPSNCNLCAHIDFSFCHPLGNPFNFTFQKSLLWLILPRVVVE
jgi:hypothetical protein